MTAFVIQLAKAVRTQLNLASLSMPIAAVVLYSPDFELPELHDLRVTVAPASRAQRVETRATVRADFSILVGVQKKVAATEGPEVEALFALVEEIDDLLRQNPHPPGIPARWMESENEPAYDPDHLRELGVFTSVIQAGYRAVRT